MHDVRVRVEWEELRGTEVFRILADKPEPTAAWAFFDRSMWGEARWYPLAPHARLEARAEGLTRGLWDHLSSQLPFRWCGVQLTLSGSCQLDEPPGGAAPGDRPQGLQGKVLISLDGSRADTADANPSCCQPHADAVWWGGEAQSREELVGLRASGEAGLAQGGAEADMHLVPECADDDDLVLFFWALAELALEEDLAPALVALYHTILATPLGQHLVRHLSRTKTVWARAAPPCGGESGRRMFLAQQLSEQVVMDYQPSLASEAA